VTEEIAAPCLCHCAVRKARPKQLARTHVMRSQMFDTDFSWIVGCRQKA
jgi:hypothetical protein